MSRGNIYRRKADELRSMASAAETDSLRLGLLDIADQYEALAELAEAWERASRASVVNANDRKSFSVAGRHAGAVVIGLLSDELG